MFFHKYAVCYDTRGTMGVLLHLVKRFTNIIYRKGYHMKKPGILNSRISAVVSQMGHKYTLAIGDAGLPVPMGTEKIDLAVKLQDPTFQTVLETVLTELEVEGITLAEEIKTANPEQLAAIKKVLPDVEVTFISHEDFKKELANTRAVIRTGESHPFANIILRSGVIF